MKLIFFSAFVVLVLPVAALSQDNKDDTALKMFEAGNQLFKAGSYVEAAEQFRKTYDLKPSYKILYNIAQSEAAAKRYGAALEAFEKYLAHGGDAIGLVREKEVREEIRRLRERTGILEVEGPDGMVILVDGTVRGTFPTARRVALAAGVVHQVRGSLGDQFEEKEIQILGGDTLKLVFDPEKDASAAPNAQTASDRKAVEPNGDSRKRLFFLTGIALAGVGGAALVAGAITGGVAMNKENLLGSKCGNHVCSSKEQGIIDSRDRLGVANIVLLSVGGTVAATGAALILVSKLKKEKQVSLLPSANGVTIMGRF